MKDSYATANVFVTDATPAVAHAGPGGSVCVNIGGRTLAMFGYPEDVERVLSEALVSLRALRTVLA